MSLRVKIPSMCLDRKFPDFEKTYNIIDTTIGKLTFYDNIMIFQSMIFFVSRMAALAFSKTRGFPAASSLKQSDQHGRSLFRNFLLQLTMTSFRCWSLILMSAAVAAVREESGYPVFIHRTHIWKFGPSLEVSYWTAV